MKPLINRKGTWILQRSGNRKTSALLVWLASHRNRLRCLMFGSKHFAILVIYDKGGSKLVKRDDEEIRAMTRIVNGR